MNNEDKLDEYFLISTSNQQSIKSLTQIIERTSRDIDKLVETQNKILITQTDMKVLGERIEVNTKDIDNLKDSQKWTLRTVLGGIITILSSVVIFYITHK